MRVVQDEVYFSNGRKGRGGEFRGVFWEGVRVYYNWRFWSR